MAFDAQFYEGFDTYGPAGFVPIALGVSDPNSSLLGGEWTSAWGQLPATSAGLTCTVVPSLEGQGEAMQIATTSTVSGGNGLSRTDPASYARRIGSFYLNIPLFEAGSFKGIVFGDTGYDQMGIGVNNSGQFIFFLPAFLHESALGSTAVATSSASIAQSVTGVVDYDVTFHNTAGIVKVWLNNTLILNVTGTCTVNVFDIFGNPTVVANHSANEVRLLTTAGGSGNARLIVDHFEERLFLAAGSGDVPYLTNPIIATDFPNDDDSSAFAVGAAVLGPDYSATTATNAPGANELFLRQFTPDVNGTVNSVCILPETTSLTAKFKAVAYADSAGVAGALLSDGTEVIGCAAGVALASALVTPQAYVAGTPIWIGMYGDTSISLGQQDTNTHGYKVARTYGSGAPGTAGAMTANQPSWVIFGLSTAVTAQWSIIDDNPYSGDRSYIWSANVSDAFLMDFPALATTPAVIYGVALKAVVRRAGSGARTFDLIVKQAATTDAGSAPGQAMPSSYGTIASYWSLDPDSAAAWNASGVANADYGGRIAS